ncbi:hypothetical protein RUM44_008083 [Polyplax serrata]|uniref:Uncharacterized protein n=1 Tax=Polyplax serrata TaxID=468196 RepID=A0ABR1BBB8_POLSC
MDKTNMMECIRGEVTYYLTPYRPIRLTTCRALLTEMGFFWVKKKVTTETIANSHTCMGFPIELINLTLTVNVKDDSFADSRRNVVGSDAEDFPGNFTSSSIPTRSHRRPPSYGKLETGAL